MVPEKPSRSRIFQLAVQMQFNGMDTDVSGICISSGTNKSSSAVTLTRARICLRNWISFIRNEVQVMC